MKEVTTSTQWPNRMRVAGRRRLTFLGLLAFGSCHLLVGCQWLAGEPDPVRPAMTGEADRRTDRGYRPIDPNLPRVGWDGQSWTPVGREAGAGLEEFFEQTVIIEGRMALDGSSPYRESFRMVHSFDGCVFKDHREHTDDIIHVTLPSGQSVQVTDKPLEVQGVLRMSRNAQGEPRLTLQATAVSTAKPPPDRSPGKSQKGPES